MLTMQLWSLSEEKIQALEKLMRDKKIEYDTLKSKTIFQIWENDLQEFLAVLDDHEAKEEEARQAGGQVNAKSGKAKGRNKGKSGKAPAKKGKKGTENAPEKKKEKENKRWGTVERQKRRTRGDASCAVENSRHIVNTYLCASIGGRTDRTRPKR